LHHRKIFYLEPLFSVQFETDATVEAELLVFSKMAGLGIAKRTSPSVLRTPSPLGKATNRRRTHA
jgi:hypothetical protein